MAELFADCNPLSILVIFLSLSFLVGRLSEKEDDIQKFMDTLDKYNKGHK